MKMALPRYIICSQDRIVDRTTGLISHVNVIDKVEITLVPTPPAADGITYVVPEFPIARLQMTAIWMKEDEGDDDAYEFDITLHRTDGESDVLGRGEFVFEKRFHRIQAEIAFTTRTKVRESGIMRFENRIRRLGSDGWLSQSFPLEVEVKNVDASEAAEKANH